MVQKCLYQKSRKGPATVGVTQSFIELLKKTAEPGIVNVSKSVGSLSLQSEAKLV